MAKTYDFHSCNQSSILCGSAILKKRGGVVVDMTVTAVIFLLMAFGIGCGTGFLLFAGMDAVSRNRAREKEKLSDWHRKKDSEDNR